MAEQLQRYKNRRADGGVNTWVHPLDIEDTQAVELQNIDSSVPGIRKKRQGTTITATGITYGPVLGLGAFTPVASASYPDTLLLAVAPGATSGTAAHRELWEWDGSASQWTSVGTLTGYTAASGYIIHPADDIGLGVLGSRTSIAIIFPTDADIADRWYYDGSSLAQAGALGDQNQAGGYAVDTVLNWTLVSGRHSQNSKAFFLTYASPASTGLETTANSFLMGGPRTKNHIVAIRGFRSQEAIIFLDDAIEELILSAFGEASLTKALYSVDSVLEPKLNWQRRVIDSTIGCGSQRSIAKVSEDLFFADQHGNIRSLARTALDASQGTRSLPISNNLQTYIDRINAGYIDQIVATAFDRYYIVGFPLDASTQPDNVFVYDTVRQAWDGPWTGINPTAFVATKLSASGAAAADKDPTVFVSTTETSEGRVLRMFRGTTDFGSSIEYKETGKRIDGGELALEKTWARIEIYASATADVDVTLEVNPDAKGWVTIGTFNVLGDAPTLPVGLTFTIGGTGVVLSKFSLESIERARDLQIRFTADTTDAVSILGYSLFFYPETFEWEND